MLPWQNKLYKQCQLRETKDMLQLLAKLGLLEVLRFLIVGHVIGLFMQNVGAASPEALLRTSAPFFLNKTMVSGT